MTTTNRCHEHQNGWDHIVDKALAKILEITPDNKIRRCKEKFGTLDIVLDYYPQDPEQYAKIRDIIKAAFEESSVTCEYCGKPSEVRSINHWLTTRCDECQKKREERDGQKPN